MNNTYRKYESLKIICVDYSFSEVFQVCERWCQSVVSLRCPYGQTFSIILLYVLNIPIVLNSLPSYCQGYLYSKGAFASFVMLGNTFSENKLNCHGGIFFLIITKNWYLSNIIFWSNYRAFKEILPLNWSLWMSIIIVKYFSHIITG